MNFESALALLKEGVNVGRKSWNEKGASLEIVTVRVACEQIKKVMYQSVWFDTTGKYGWPGKPLPQISQMHWAASDDDVLAEDWMIVDVKWHMEHPHG